MHGYEVHDLRSRVATVLLPVGEFTTAYNALRFGGHIEVAPRLSILLDELERKIRRKRRELDRGRRTT